VRAYNNRGAAWGRKGDLDRAIADYEQALRIDPQMHTAAENVAALRKERDRRDAAKSGGSAGANTVLPTFNCDTAERAVEKAICSDPELARLDRQIDDAYKAALAKLNRREAGELRRQQRAFVARRNKSFGDPEYQTKKEFERRLKTLEAATH